MFQKKNNAVFLDRDGTLNTDCGYVYQLKDLELIHGAADALQIFQEAGYLLIVITNQSGVARGYYKAEDVSRFNDALKSELDKFNVTVTAFYVCMHAPEDNCDCRKPSPKLVNKAIKDYNIDAASSFMFGDKESDIVCGENAHVPSFLVTREHSLYFWANKLKNNCFKL